MLHRSRSRGDGRGNHAAARRLRPSRDWAGHRLVSRQCRRQLASCCRAIGSMGRRGCGADPSDPVDLLAGTAQRGSGHGRRQTLRHAGRMARTATGIVDLLSGGRRRSTLRRLRPHATHAKSQNRTCASRIVSLRGGSLRHLCRTSDHCLVSGLLPLAHQRLRVIAQSASGFL